MPDPSKSRYEVTAYIMVAVVVATLVGTLIGAMFADTDAGRASVGIVAHFCAVAAEIVIRRYLGRSLPQFFLSDRERMPRCRSGSAASSPRSLPGSRPAASAS